MSDFIRKPLMVFYWAISRFLTRIFAPQFF
jgi:hypothetical protein